MPVTEIPSGLVRALNERYELRGVLGRGGMATVYIANDRKHHRSVAIKVLRPEIAASLGADRFLKEIEIVARLTHPHILPLHDSGEAAEFLYYVMPAVDGGSLRQELERTRQMRVDQALSIAAPVANALSYAHRMGLLHRDVKPENILFLQGHPVVSDFGIARAVRSATDESFTRTGLALGTPGYMSPEQAAGVRDLSEASDVYSLAAVLYEMMVGHVPTYWPTEDEVHAGRFMDAPALHRNRLTDAGPRAEAALLRGLALRPDRRTATPDALIDDLKGVAAPPARRKYGPEEISAIIRRAAELEVSQPAQTGAMTIGGIEEVAADVGIKPGLVRQAADSMRVRPSSISTNANKPNVLAGGPMRLVYDRVVEGELPESEFSVLADEIRRHFQHVGQVNQLGRSFSWTMQKSGGMRRELEVVVTIRGGHTRITVQETLGQLAGGIFGGLGGGLGGGGLGPIVAVLMRGLHLQPGALAVIIPAWILTVYGIARTSFHYASKSRARSLEAAADMCADVARELIDDAARGRIPDQNSRPLR